jgi:hypothetical protein
MCITSRIEALEAQIARLKKLEAATAPVKNLLTELLSDYAKEAPEELPGIWQEVLAIGQQHNLSVQPLVLEELRQWQTVQAENEKLRQEIEDLKEWRAQEFDALEQAEAHLKTLKLQIEEYQATYINASSKLTDEEYDAAVEEELALDDDTIDSILKSTGFQQIERFFSFWDATDKYENYRGWDIYFGVPNGGLVAIGLHNLEYNQAWDTSTENIREELDPTFPESLANFDEIIAWTRALIDRVENLEAPGQLALEFPTAVVAETSQLIESSKKEGAEFSDEEGASSEAAEEAAATDHRYRNFNQIFELQDFKVDVRQHNNGDDFAGASFNFYRIRENQPTICTDNLIYSKSLTATECGNKSPKELATEIIEHYWQRLREQKEREANPYKKSEDDFIELVKITPYVGYLKRRDSGELIAAYAAFANRDSAGNKTTTLAKVRAKKWRDYLHSSFESCGWKVEEPRKIKRMAAQPGEIWQPAYEIKITGKFSIGQLQKLAEEDFSLLPNEILKPVKSTTPVTYQITVNGYEVASGTEDEMRSRLDTELKTFGKEGRRVITLMSGGRFVERYSDSYFKFVPAQDFDEENPEYSVLHLPTNTNFRVYLPLVRDPESGWLNSIYPYSGASTKEAAAVDAVRRLLKAKELAE